MYDRRVYHFFGQRGFLPLGRDNYPLFKEYESYSDLQEMSMVMIITWSSASRGLYKLIHGHLCCVYFYDQTPVCFTIHRGKSPDCSLQRVIDILYGLCREAELPSLRVKFIDERRLGEFQAVQGYAVTTEFSRDNCEYIYKNKDFLSLKGTINGTKRKRLNKCFNDPSITFQTINNKNVELCLGIQEEWCRGRDCVKCASFCGCERDALKIMIDIFDERVHKGIFLRVNRIPMGYSIGEIISEKMSFVYFGKALNNNHFLYGLYTLSTNLYNSAEYLNLNEDMGNEGLRQFKSHLGIYSLLNKHICTFEKKEGQSP